MVSRVCRRQGIAERSTDALLTRGRIVSGGSTLTMQVARLLEPRPRTVRSKIGYFPCPIAIDRGQLIAPLLQQFI